MGRGRKGVISQSVKKRRTNRSRDHLRLFITEHQIPLCFDHLGPHEITANEIKIAEQMTPQQLVNLLLVEGSDK